MSIITSAKEIADLVQKLGNIELYRKIVELEGQIIELTRENHSLSEQVNELQKQLAFKSQIQYEGKMYRRVDGTAKTGPYCQRCYDVDRKLVRLQSWDDAWMCFGCKFSVPK
jgi:regulator of replication initiation timing